MGAGTPADKFRDFMEVTGPSYLTGPEVIINEAVKRRYIWGELIRGKEKAVQGGTKIQESIMFDDGSTFQMYQPNQTFTWSNPQVLDTLNSNWRFAIDHVAWTDHEIELNAGEDMSVAAQKATYKRLKKSKEQRMATSLTNGLEDTLWESPFSNTAEMESDSGKKVFSIPVFINDMVKTTADGMRGHAYSGWTTVAGVNPATEPLWTNQVVMYDRTIDANSLPLHLTTEIDYNVNETADKTHDIFGLITAFDEMWLKVCYIPPDTNSQYFEDDHIRQQMIWTSRLGVNQYKRALRASNDRLVPVDDAAYASPRFSGIPVKYCSNLDTAPLYLSDAAGTVPDTRAGRVDTGNIAVSTTAGTHQTHDLTIDKGPRYYFINAAYLTCFIHARRYMVKHDVMRHPNQPFTNIQPTDTWWNLLACSRQRHGIVTPRIRA